MKKQVLAALIAALIATPAVAVTIDFEGLPAGDNPNPLTVSGTTFTTPGGFNYIAASVISKALCPSTSATSPANCSLNLEVSFGGNASAISFAFYANNNRTVGADIGDVDIYSGATLLGTTDVLVTDTDGLTKDLVALTGFSNVTGIVISSTDFGGVLYDDFDFALGQGQVPEPATWALLGLGLAGLGLRRRKRSS